MERLREHLARPGRFFLVLLGLLAPLSALPAARVGDGAAPVLVGMTDTAAYFPLLRGRRVAVLANHTAVARPCELGSGATPEAHRYAGAAAQTALPTDGAGRVHLVDLLHASGIDVRGIFAPEHGFRGEADAGAAVADGHDAATGIPILSLYDGNARRPSDEAMRSFDVLVVDMQDVGVRFYTYHISMLRLMEACAACDRPVVVLDRPNPHGEKVDGPVLDLRYASGVGALPVPVLHGLTMGELARMAVGEGWCAPCDLTVVRCRGYAHSMPYELPVPPSPNLPTQRSVWLYPSLCLFEGTVVSVGRGTERPFECYGHPDLSGDCLFVPRSVPGAMRPLHEGIPCRGRCFGSLSDAEARAVGLNLGWLLGAYRELGLGDRFFTPMFEKLIGVDWVRPMIEAGASEREIRARWAPETEAFRRLRARYLLYDE